MKPATARLAAAATLTVLVAAACGTGSATAIPQATSSPTALPSLLPTPAASGSGQVSIPAFKHVYLVVMENKSYSEVVGSNQAPYINSLIARYGLATNFFAVGHPSEPNYVAMVAGGTDGVASDGAYNLNGQSLFSELTAAHKTWHVYEQSYPGNCYTGSSAGPTADGPGFPGLYARKHNPAISFMSISHDPSLCAQISDLRTFDPSAADFEMIVPNQYNDMHSAPPSGTAVMAGDSFLAHFMPSILNSPAFADSAVFITWDEGRGGSGGGQVATIVASPNMTAGFKSNTSYTDYSLLRTIEQAWGLPYLGQAAQAQAMQFPY